MEPLHKTKQILQSGLPLKIVALGDSLTEGWMEAKGYCDYLAELITEHWPLTKLTLINKGIPGDTAYGGLQRADEDVIEHKPDLTLIQFGLNDAYQGYKLANFIQYIQSIIDAIRANTGSDIIPVTSSLLINKNDRAVMDTFYNALADLADRNSLIVARTHAAWEQAIQNGTDHYSLLQEDLVHPTTAGYELMAQAIINLLHT